MNKIYNLFKTGYVISAIIFALIVLIGIILVKYPEEQLSFLIMGVGKCLYYEKFYIIPLSLTLIFSITANIIQKFIYKKEIKRLIGKRKDLIHGLDHEDLNKLKIHNTTKDTK